MKNDNRKDAEVAFLKAASRANLEGLQHWLGQGVDVNCQDEDGSTALMLAITYVNNTENGSKECGHFLLKQPGIKLDCQDQYGNTALILASESRAEGDEDDVDLPLKMIDMGANYNISNKRGVTALMKAAEYGEDYEALVEKLIEVGADVYAKDKDGDSAVHYAIRFGCYNVAGLLMDALGAKNFTITVRRPRELGNAQSASGADVSLFESEKSREPTDVPVKEQEGHELKK